MGKRREMKELTVSSSLLPRSSCRLWSDATTRERQPLRGGESCGTCGTADTLDVLQYSSFTLTTPHCTGSEALLTSGSTLPANSTRTLGLMAYSEEEIWMTIDVRRIDAVLDIQDEKDLKISGQENI